MSIEDILASIQESHEAAKNHLLAQAEYEAGQILAQKKAQLEEWKAKQELEWKEKLARESKNQRSHIDILIDQEKKRTFYEGALALFEESIKHVFTALCQDMPRYKQFLLECIQKAANVWNVRQMTIVLSEQDSSLWEEITSDTTFSLKREKGRMLSGGVICRYGQEEFDFSFEQIRETLQPEMIQWIYKCIHGEE